MVGNIRDYLEKINKEIYEFSKEGNEYNDKIIGYDRYFISMLSEYIITPQTVEYENKQKSIDVIIDILKFLIPISFTLWITSLSLSILFHASTWLIIILLILILILIFSIYKRIQLTEKYISYYKVAYDILMKHFRGYSIKKIDGIDKVSRITLGLHQEKIREMLKEVDAEIKKKYNFK